MFDTITSFFKKLVWFKKPDGTQEQREITETVVDTYLVADSFETLTLFCSHFRNVIGPVQGFYGRPESVDEEGNVMPSSPMGGDPDKFYACIRAPFQIVPCDGVSGCDVGEGSAVCGVWA